MQSSEVQISVIIVSYNTKEVLDKCINSIKENTSNINYEIIISDNHSTDGTLEMLDHDSDIILIKNNYNLGFGKANNIAAKRAKGEYLLFLNSDTILLNNALYEFYRAATESKEDYLWGSLLLDIDGKPTHSYSDFTKPIKGVYRCVIQTYPHLHDFCLKTIFRKKAAGYRQTEKIDTIIGADIFIKKNDFMSLNGFDDRYFLFFEDEDLCRRAKLELHLQCSISKYPKIQHLECASSKNKAKKIGYFEKSFIIFSKKYYTAVQRLFITLFFYTYSLVRMLDLRIV